MPQQKTHREAKKPQISARYLADYMAASETARRTIIRNCKFQPIARVIQHNEAKIIISKFIREGKNNIDNLKQEAQRIRSKIADSAFDKDLHEHNADYVARFAHVAAGIDFPEADITVPGQTMLIDLHGVKVTVELSNRLQRVTRTNKIKIGATMLRYAKGKALLPLVGEWQSALLFGYLGITNTQQAADPEHKLCLTIDAYSGEVYPAPSDSTRRFQNVEAACATIAERWPNIQPPPGAVL